MLFFSIAYFSLLATFPSLDPLYFHIPDSLQLIPSISQLSSLSLSSLGLDSFYVSFRGSFSSTSQSSATISCLYSPSLHTLTSFLLSSVPFPCTLHIHFHIPPNSESLYQSEAISFPSLLAIPRVIVLFLCFLSFHTSPSVPHPSQSRTFLSVTSSFIPFHLSHSQAISPSFHPTSYFYSLPFHTLVSVSHSSPPPSFPSLPLTRLS